MWSDNDIDQAFQRLNPPEPEPTPFPLDGWLQLETRLDQAVIARAVRRKLWRVFAAEVAVVALVALGWLLWPGRGAVPMQPVATTVAPATHRPSLALGPTAPQAAESVWGQPVTAAKPKGKGRTTTGVSAAASASSAATVAVATPKAAKYANRAPAVVSTTFKQKSREERIYAALSPASSPTLARRDENRSAARSLRGATLLGLGARSRRSASHFPDAPVPTPHTAGVAALRGEEPTGAVGIMPQGGETRRGIKARQSVAFWEGQRIVAKRKVRLQIAKTTVSSPSGITGRVAADATQPGAGNGLLPLPALPVALQHTPAAQLPTSLPGAEAPPALAETPPALVAKQPRFYVGVVGAPDVTTVKFASVQSPLPNVGFVVEYRLGSRLRLSTGLLRSTKQYVARREDYDWGTYASRVYQRDFKDVDGACTVLDVPLNLRYDVVATPRHRVFGSAGLSSFFMQRERYTYAYVENNVPMLWERAATNENQHVLSIVNLSFGYERSLGSRWSMQAEPYVKLPLGGVGAGKVQLTSAGVFLGVKYGL